MFGGGMRQAGVIAAAGNRVGKVAGASAHRSGKCQALGEGIAEIPGLTIDSKKVCSNIVIFDCTKTGKTAVELCDALHPHGVWAQDTGCIRCVCYALRCEPGGDRAGASGVEGSGFETQRRAHESNGA